MPRRRRVDPSALRLLPPNLTLTPGALQAVLEMAALYEDEENQLTANEEIPIDVARSGKKSVVVPMVGTTGEPLFTPRLSRDAHGHECERVAKVFGGMGSQPADHKLAAS